MVETPNIAQMLVAVTNETVNLTDTVHPLVSVAWGYTYEPQTSQFLNSLVMGSTQILSGFDSWRNF